MSGNSAYYIIREIISSFLIKGNILDEEQIIDFVIEQLRAVLVVDIPDRNNFDFYALYSIFNIFDALGFISRKFEPNQKKIQWIGFTGFCGKYKLINQSEIQLQEKFVEKNTEKDKAKIDPLQLAIEATILAFLNALLKDKEKNEITSEEYQNIYFQTLLSECGLKEKEQRKKYGDYIIKIFNYMNFIEISQKTLNKLNFKVNSQLIIQLLTKNIESFNENEFFEKRRKVT